ncbi:hypothetical protein [Aliivibrio kagoshimensis]|uniref:hypothetical protein n=1 Tax=Aliivibrio kagoshimensis TaxID=2910230 RepID=UPI003D0E722B
MKWILRILFPLLLTASVMANGVIARESELSIDWDYQLSGGQHWTQSSPLFSDSSDGYRFDTSLQAEARYGGWLGLFALTSRDVQHDGESSDVDVIVQELFWQQEVTMFDQALELTLGKVRLDWAVGHGYRPLDIIKPYRQNPIGIQIEEGAGVASLSSFDLSGEWTLLFSDSSWVMQEQTTYEQTVEQQGVGVRRYWLDESSEWQGLLYYDNMRKTSLGASVVTVVNEAWELHASVLFQQQFTQYHVTDDHYTPVTLQTEEHAGQGLLGLTWANSSGNSVIVEYWYDSRAWSDSEWEAAIHRARSLTLEHQLSAQSLAKSYGQGFSHANIVQHNVMFHWSLDSTAFDQFQYTQGLELTPTLDILYSPQDEGVIVTQWFEYLLFDTGDYHQTIEIAGRFIFGAHDSAYQQIADNRLVLINAKGRF